LGSVTIILPGYVDVCISPKKKIKKKKNCLKISLNLESNSIISKKKKTLQIIKMAKLWLFFWLNMFLHQFSRAKKKRSKDTCLPNLYINTTRSINLILCKYVLLDNNDDNIFAAWKI
jgi:hypothetical protein